MANLTPADIKAKFPEFDGVDDAIIQGCLDDAYCMLNPDACSACVGENMIYYAVGHCLAKNPNVDGGDDSVYPASSRAVGSVSESYAVQTPTGGFSKGWYMTTPYGMKFLQFRKLCVGGAVTIAP